MKVLVAVLLVVAVSASHLKEEIDKFQEFKTKYGKIFKSHAEETKRFKNFKENLRSIEEHNALYEHGLSSYKKGITKFADLTQEEFKAMLTVSPSNKPRFNATRHINTGLAIPDSVDWRTDGQVTEVKDQEHCGSYWAFSIAGSTEGAYKRSTGKLVSLSAQQLVDCATDVNDGCRSGYLSHTTPYVKKYGLQSEDSYPYNASTDDCKFSPDSVVAKVSDFISINPEKEDELLDAVANVGPVSVAMDASFLYTYNSGIYQDDRCSPSGITHAALIVGYGTEDSIPFWIVKNSWGTSFGEDGFFRIIRGQNECGISEEAWYAII